MKAKKKYARAIDRAKRERAEDIIKRHEELTAEANKCPKLAKPSKGAIWAQMSEEFGYSRQHLCKMVKDANLTL